MDRFLDDIHEPDASQAATASHFASWVYRKYHPRAGRGEFRQWRAARMRLGQATHADIERYRLWADRRKIGVATKSDWQAVFADTHDSDCDKVFFASRLKYNGQPLRCKPDLVLREVSSGKVIIVERKVTTTTHLRRVTEWGYARIRAQLWCYAWIDDWSDAPAALMVSEWWADQTCSPVRPCWWRSTPTLQSECLRYFKEYGGQWVEPAPASAWQSTSKDRLLPRREA
jgi:hypothetical protein